VHLTRGDPYQQSWRGGREFADLPGVRTEAPAEQGPEHRGVADTACSEVLQPRGRGLGGSEGSLDRLARAEVAGDGKGSWGAGSTTCRPGRPSNLQPGAGRGPAPGPRPPTSQRLGWGLGLMQTSRGPSHSEEHANSRRSRKPHGQNFPRKDPDLRKESRTLSPEASTRWAEPPGPRECLPKA